MELFRRAISERDELAWTAIVAEYSDLVRAWIRQHPSAAQLSADDDLISGTFARFWAAVGPDRWLQFADLKSLLGYLKLCAHSLVVDHVRVERRASSCVSLDRMPGVTLSVHQDVLEDIAADQLWTVILSLLPDETERLLIYLCLVRDMKPAEVWARHPARFASVADVYRAKRNVIERLRRSPELRSWCSRSDGLSGRATT
jgi:DNA-directed RNA polymerase specialized sigma24 family protein